MGENLGMGNLAVFVDAGYLFKQGSEAVFKTKLGRHQLTFEAGRFIEHLTKWLGETYPRDELMRTYWYDGAKQGVAMPDQQSIAALSFVKLRLGRINSSGQQKGVDTLIVRDLMVLSQERSIQRAVVLSGDEDLREGIEYVQDRGVRVAILGINSNHGSSQSVELVREADQALMIPKEILEETLSRKEIYAVPGLRAPSSPTIAKKISAPSSSGGLVAHAREFAHEWMTKATGGELTALLSGRPRIPKELDAALLQHAVQASGIKTIEEGPRKAMRLAFWNVIAAEDEL